MQRFVNLGHSKVHAHSLAHGLAQKLHDNVLDPLNHLLALALGLPENYLTSLHQWKSDHESHLRYMKYGKFSQPEIDALEDGLWTRGHTDLGTLTLLFRQPVAGLQIRDNETGKWKWAKPVDGSLTVNAGDALSFITGGYIKSTIHRVSHQEVRVNVTRNVDYNSGIPTPQRPATCGPSRLTLLWTIPKRSCAQNNQVTCSRA